MDPSKLLVPLQASVTSSFPLTHKAICRIVRQSPSCPQFNYGQNKLPKIRAAAMHSMGTASMGWNAPSLFTRTRFRNSWGTLALWQLRCYIKMLSLLSTGVIIRHKSSRVKGFWQ